MTEGLRLAVAALDKEYGPLWDERINLNRLRMDCLDNCILGQLGVVEWSDTVDRLVGWNSVDKNHSTFWFCGHGDQWREFIQARRAERA